MLLQAVHYDFHPHSRKNMTTQEPTHKRKHLWKGERWNWINGWTTNRMKLWREILEWNLHYLTQFIPSSSHTTLSALPLRVPYVIAALEIKMGADFGFSGSHRLESKSEQAKFTTSWVSNSEENQTTQQEKMSQGCHSCLLQLAHCKSSCLGKCLLA